MNFRKVTPGSLIRIKYYQYLIWDVVKYGLQYKGLCQWRRLQPNIQIRLRYSASPSVLMETPGYSIKIDLKQPRQFLMIRQYDNFIKRQKAGHTSFNEWLNCSGKIMTPDSIMGRTESRRENRGSQIKSKSQWNLKRL